jgi:hypothetical protein
MVLTDRNKVTINQKGGAVALIVNSAGLDYGTKVAFGNTYRKLKLDSNYTAPDCVLEVKHGDIVMVILPPENGECRLNPYEIGAIAKDYHDDFGAIDEFIAIYLPEGTVAVTVARIEKTID